MYDDDLQKAELYYEQMEAINDRCRMKKVALFVDDMNRHAFFERLSGIQEQGQKLGLDLTLHVFHSRASFGLDPDYNTGEYNIFNLPDLQTYDGFILDLFNYFAREGKWYGGDMCQRLIERIRKTKIPTVAIGNDIQGFPYHSEVRTFKSGVVDIVQL